MTLWLADRAFLEALPRQIDWHAEKARALAPDFPFDADNKHSEGVMEAVRRYFNEIEPPAADAPDVVKMMHWGLGYYLVKPVSQDPSRDPLPAQIHSQTVEMFAYVLYAWPELKTWLPQSFYDRCRDFAFAHCGVSGLLKVSPWWDASTYIPVTDMRETNPMGGHLHPYKGRHAIGHSVQPNRLMHEVAKREGRSNADDYLNAAQTQARWIVEHDVTARIELTRGAICASPGSEQYPLNPKGRFRHPEGWVNFNAAWNVALATWETNRRQQAESASNATSDTRFQ